MGDHFLQMQEVLYTGHLSCLVQGWIETPEGIEQVPQILEVYTGVLVFDPLQTGGGGALQKDTLYAILPAGPRSAIAVGQNYGHWPVQNYRRQLDEVTVIATPASIGGHPDTVAVDSAQASVRRCASLFAGNIMNMLVLSVNTAIHDGRLQRVAYQVTTLTSALTDEPYDTLREWEGELLQDTDRAEDGPPL